MRSAFFTDLNKNIQCEELNMAIKDESKPENETKEMQAEPGEEKLLPEEGTPDAQVDTKASGEPANLEKSTEEKLTLELKEIKDRYLRLLAEFDNFKKIAHREQQNSVRFGNEALITNLLPIIDNLEQAILAQKKSSEEKNDILIGLEMVLKQLYDLLTKFGVEVFNAKGQPFDPARHEALCEQENESAPPGTVIIEYQKGYLLSGRLLRPARVAVAAKKPGIV
ncbi:MAG TPA: nucleotide exchange factor GrpE [Myxococcota bacterium]|nr:nucleotide exchange factor GrpE [Myxococcota bacterium]